MTPLRLNLSPSSNTRYIVTGRRELTPDDVRRLAFEAFELIDDAQKELNLPICPQIDETRRRMRGGVFRAIPLSRKRGAHYAMEYGSFDPPSTIVLDSRLPFCDRPLDISQLPSSMAQYSATHEVIHADDYTGGDTLLVKTMEHILRSHRDKLEKGMSIIEQQGGCECIKSYEDLARLWAMQYVDMATHYRAYVVLRFKKLPKLDFIWSHLQSDFFPPTLLTRIEQERGAENVFDTITCRAGEYCLIDALRDSQNISEKDASKYTV